jgi:hypothetical protein
MTNLAAPAAIGIAPVNLRAGRRAAIAGVAVAAAAVAIGLRVDAPRVWSNLLVDGFLTVGLALGGLSFLSIHYLSGAAWSVGMRRVAEALTALFPVAAASMLVLYLGRTALYPWARTVSGAPATSAAGWFFSSAAVFARMMVFLAAWAACALTLRRSSDAEDAVQSPRHERRAIRTAAIFAVLFAWSFPIAATDWLMSLEPEWTSTIYFVYVFAGVLVEGAAAVTLFTVWLGERGLLRDVVKPDHLHDLGKLLLAFATFWAYIWLCQYLLIWYGNIPDEATYYQLRTGPAWLFWFAGNVVVNWAIPFVALLSRSAKRNPRTLQAVAIVLLAGRWIDVYLMVAPRAAGSASWGLLEIALAAGYATVAWSIVSGALSRRPLIARHDPRLEACLHHHQ